MQEELLNLRGYKSLRGHKVSPYYLGSRPVSEIFFSLKPQLLPFSGWAFRAFDSAEQVLEPLFYLLLLAPLVALSVGLRRAAAGWGRAVARLS